MAARRRYSDEERAAALACFDACGGNLREAARRSGVPHVTLWEWVQGRVPDTCSDLRMEKKQALADVFEALARKLTGVADRKADDLNAKDAVIAAGVAVDKMQLLRGEPTATARVELTDDERAAAIHRLLAWYGQADGRPYLDGEPVAGGPPLG